MERYHMTPYNFFFGNLPRAERLRWRLPAVALVAGALACGAWRWGGNIIGAVHDATKTKDLGCATVALDETHPTVVSAALAAPERLGITDFGGHLDTQIVYAAQRAQRGYDTVRTPGPVDVTTCVAYNAVFYATTGGWDVQTTLHPPV